MAADEVRAADSRRVFRVLPTDDTLSCGVVGLRLLPNSPCLAKSAGAENNSMAGFKAGEECRLVAPVSGFAANTDTPTVPQFSGDDGVVLAAGGLTSRSSWSDRCGDTFDSRDVSRTDGSARCHGVGASGVAADSPRCDPTTGFPDGGSSSSRAAVRGGTSKGLSAVGMGSGVSVVGGSSALGRGGDVVSVAGRAERVAGAASPELSRPGERVNADVAFALPRDSDHEGISSPAVDNSEMRKEGRTALTRPIRGDRGGGGRRQDSAAERGRVTVPAVSTAGSTARRNGASDRGADTSASARLRVAN